MNKLIYTALAATMMLASCTQNEDMPINGNETFPADGVIRVTTQVSNTTRASMTSDDLTKFMMNVTHPSDDNYSYYAMMFREGLSKPWNSYELSSFWPLTPMQMLWKNSKDPVTVSAIVKNESTISQDMFHSETLYTVQPDQLKYRAWLLASDLLYMPPTKIDPATNLVDGKVKVELGHLFSKLNLKITLGTEFNINNGTENNLISDLIVNGTRWGVFFNASTNTWGKLWGDAAPIHPWHEAAMYTPGSGETTNAIANYECILIPQTVAEGAFSVTFTINDKPYEWVSTNNITLVSGKEYTLTLTAGKNIVTAGGMSVKLWESGNGTDGDNIETE